MTNTTTSTSNNSANTTNNNGGSTMNVFANTSTFRNNKFTSNNTMSNNNVVSYEIAVNIGDMYSNYDGQTNCNMFRVHNGAIRTAKADTAAFMSVNVVPLKGNMTPVFAVKEDGTKEQISSTKFWSLFVGTTDGAVNTARVRCDLGVKASFLRKARKEGILKSVRIRIDANDFTNQIVPMDVATIPSQTLGEYSEVQLRIQNADIQLSNSSVITGAKYSGNLLRNADLSMEDNTSVVSNSSIFFGAATPSPSPKARVSQTQAARAGVPAAPVAPAMDSHDAHFAAPTPKPAAPAPQPAAPGVDIAAMIQQAVSAAIAPLTQEISSLREELKAKDAEIAALKSQSNSTPIAEPTPVVEEAPTEEPIAEEATQFTDDSEEFESASNTGLPKADLFFNCDDPFADEDLEDEEVDGDDFFGTSAPSGKAAV